MDKNNPIRVLLCDDQFIVATAVHQMLSSIPGMEFSAVIKSQEIVSNIETFKPTVILQDLVMPNESGIEVVKRLRADKRFEDIPIILLSTTDDSKVKFQAFNAGASDYVVKFPESFELIGRVTYHSRAYCALKDREEAHKKLDQRSRLESLGNLAAGVAHEINTPLQFISTNLDFVLDFLKRDSSSMEMGDVFDALNESIQGAEQISKIVRAMKAFAHPGREEKVISDLNEIVRDVSVLSRNEWKDCAQLELDLEARLPAVQCVPGAVAQVLLNLVVNSAQAISEVNRLRSEYTGVIKLRTKLNNDAVEVHVEDNGGGVPEVIRERIFDPFFTTKEPGVGSGQGLTLARSIIVDGHSGELEYQPVGEDGSRFTIRLPVTGHSSF